jgi:hypothetical protein
MPWTYVFVADFASQVVQLLSVYVVYTVVESNAHAVGMRARAIASEVEKDFI